LCFEPKKKSPSEPLLNHHLTVAIITMTTSSPNNHGNITGATGGQLAQSSPNNHGKKWTTSEDEHIIDKPSLPDFHFAGILRRSEQAVQSRRAVLAAKMHKSSGLSIQECAAKLYADTGRTTVVVNNEAKRTMQKTAVKQYDNTKILTPQKPTTPKPTTARTSPTPHGPRPHPPTAIAAICSHIKRTKGDMDGVWAQDTLVPTLVLFHAGFLAYASFISADSQRAA